MQAAYKNLASYYDLFLQQKNYRREANFIRNLAKKYHKNGMNILDVGCGTGSHLNLLQNTFDQLYGVDSNPAMIKLAKRKSKKIKYRLGRMQDLRLKQKFAVISCLYSVFNYNLSKTEALKTLKNFKQHLNNQGLLIMACYYPTNTLPKVTVHYGKKTGLEVIKVNQYWVDRENKFETANFVVMLKRRNKLKVAAVEYDHKYRLYSVPELNKMLKAVGFESIKAFDGFRYHPADGKSKFPVMVARLK